MWDNTKSWFSVYKDFIPFLLSASGPAPFILWLTDDCSHLHFLPWSLWFLAWQRAAYPGIVYIRHNISMYLRFITEFFFNILWWIFLVGAWRALWMSGPFKNLWGSVFIILGMGRLDLLLREASLCQGLCHSSNFLKALWFKMKKCPHSPTRSKLQNIQFSYT